MGVLVDLSPLLDGVRGDVIRVAAVCAGARAAGIDRDAVTDADDLSPAVPGEQRLHSGGRVYRVAADGTRTELRLPERIAAVLEHGGVLRAGPIALRVTSGAVERIFVRGPSLDSLHITA